MIRQFQKSDIDRVMQLWLESNITTHNFIPEKYWESNFETVRGQILQAEVYVCEIGEAIQGFVGVSESYVAGIFVDEKYRSQGIGKELLDYIKVHNNSLTLSVYQKNGRAVRFYLREGFSIASSGIDEENTEAEYTMVWNK